MKYLSNYTEPLQTELLNNLGAFFAIGEKAFKEKRKEGVKYTYIKNMYLFVPTKNKENLFSELEAIQIKGVKQDLEENGAAKIIEREFFNYECQISGDTQDAREALVTHIEVFPEVFTDELLKTEFNKAWNKAVEQDLF